MSTIQKQNTDLNNEKIENVRIGYQVATNLWSSRAAELWSQFSALVTANSIVLAATTLAINSPNPPQILSIGMPIVGLILCTLWFFIHSRGAGYTYYWALCARELEEKHLSESLNMISRGGSLSRGKEIDFEFKNSTIPFRMRLMGRMIRVESLAYLVIAVFSAMYLGLLFGL